MTHKQAVNLLDNRKAGADYPESRILEALHLTGDYQNDFNPELAASMAIDGVAA